MSRGRSSVANITSMLALVVALSAGSAAIASHLVVRRSDIVNNAINSAKVEDDTLTGQDVKESTFGKVPNARAVNGLRIRNLHKRSTSVTSDYQPLAQIGPLVIEWWCVDSGGGGLAPVLRARTTQNDATILTAWNNYASGDDGKVDVDFDIGEETILDGGDGFGAISNFVYTTSSGRVISGTVSDVYTGPACLFAGTVIG